MEVLEKKFDRELTLRDLISAAEIIKLKTVLLDLLGADASIADLEGGILVGAEPAHADAHKHPLRLEIEPIGHLLGTNDAKHKAMALAIEMLLRSAWRYHMASDLHIEAVQADYEKLQMKNAQLRESEHRYKALSEQLSLRVEAQVKDIEDKQRQLYQAEKMASVGRLAAGVAHEINNPLGFIRSNLSTAQSYLQGIGRFTDAYASGGDSQHLTQAWQQEKLVHILPDFKTLLTESIDGADRIKKIVADLKDFSNVDRNEEQIADVNEIIKSTCAMAATQIGQRAELKLVLTAIPRTRCSPGHLGQVFLNLLQNSADALGEKVGVISIHSRHVKGEIEVTIADTGCGIPQAMLDKIFDPFYTSKEVGKGTGLGLTVSRDIIHAHNGRLAISSTEGKGTEIRINLPVVP